MKTRTNALLVPLFSVFILPIFFLACDPGGGMTEPEPEPTPVDTTGTSQNTGADISIEINITEGMVDDSCFTGLSVQILDSASSGNNYNYYHPIVWSVGSDPEGIVYIQSWRNEGEYNVRLYNSAGTLIDRGRFNVTSFDIENQRDERVGFVVSKSDDPLCP